MAGIVKNRMKRVKEEKESILDEIASKDEQLAQLETKKVSTTPARKKKNPTYTIKRSKGKIEIITQAERKINKTYYLEQSCVDTIEIISKNTGLNPSEIIKLAIQELNSKLVYTEEIT